MRSGSRARARVAKLHSLAQFGGHVAERLAGVLLQRELDRPIEPIGVADVAEHLGEFLVRHRTVEKDLAVRGGEIMLPDDHVVNEVLQEELLIVG
jgi:DNA-binding transcriptional ArsR family regulator